MATVVCPQCNKDDLIQKVSAVVASGISTGNFSGPMGGTAYIDGKSGGMSGYTHLSGQSITELAKVIAAPLEPIKPKGIGLLWLLLILAPFFVANIIHSLSGETLPALSAAGGIVTFLYLLYWLYEKNKKKIDAAKLQYSVDKISWEKAFAIWNRLYYCHRNGIVFDPDTGKTCEPANIKNFIYEQS